MRFAQILPSKGNPAPSPSLSLAAPPSPFQQVHKTVNPREIYGNLIHQSRSLISGLSSKPVKLPDIESVCETVDLAIEALRTDYSGLLEFVERSTPEHYLPGHLANCAILSLALAQNMQWDSEAMRAVGVGALLHDVGEIFNRAETPAHGMPENRGERHRLRVAPRECLDLLKGFLHSLNSGSRAIIENIILQSQERISGKGTPLGLRDDAISREAKVVGLCHAYESLSHPRPYHERKLSHDALRIMIELSGDEFDGNLIQKLWESLSLFPPGSYVRLNNQSVARVEKIHRGQPLKPIVRPIVLGTGERAPSAAELDMSLEPELTIESAVDECEIKYKDPRLLLEVKARKWWMD